MKSGYRIDWSANALSELKKTFGYLLRVNSIEIKMKIMDTRIWVF